MPQGTSSRFANCKNLTDIHTLIEDLRARAERIKISASKKGPQSNDFAKNTVLQGFLNDIDVEIAKFNAQEISNDHHIALAEEASLTSNLLSILTCLLQNDIKTLNLPRNNKKVIVDKAIQASLLGGALTTGIAGAFSAIQIIGLLVGADFSSDIIRNLAGTKRDMTQSLVLVIKLTAALAIVNKNLVDRCKLEEKYSEQENKRHRSLTAYALNKNDSTMKALPPEMKKEILKFVLFKPKVEMAELSVESKFLQDAIISKRFEK